MLIGILDLLLKAGAEARAKKAEEENIQIIEKSESSDTPVDKEGSWLLGLILISIPIYFLAYWFIGLEVVFLNIVGYVLFSIPVLFVLLVKIFQV